MRLLDSPPTLYEQVDACNKERDAKGEPRLTEAEIHEYAQTLKPKTYIGDSGVRFGDHTVQLPSSRPVVHWQYAASQIPACHDSAVIVEMDVWEEAKGLVQLPGAVQERLRPQSATVLAVGRNVKDLKPGDWVLVGRDKGYWIEGAVFGDYVATGQVRVYGPISSSATITLEYPYSDGVMGRIEVKE